ncbi:MAG: hypothetical protein ACREQ7_07450 [Candidatus Binatia bacterium]
MFEKQAILNGFKNRTSKVLEIERVRRDRTYLMGYLSAGEVVAEHERALRLNQIIDQLGKVKTWLSLERAVNRGISDAQQKKEIHSLINKFRDGSSRKASVSDLKRKLDIDLNQLRKPFQELKRTQERGERNTAIYLTWDQMDLYFATSMRKKWEYEDLYDFITQVMRSRDLRKLKLRYFDPTQSFGRNRIDKGLIESLMLKRAACTVYSVQDTDTLGKDSELAATLAQGKPVIAYAPAIDVRRRARELVKERPFVLKERFHFVSVGDEKFFTRFEDKLEFLKRFADRIDQFEEAMLWRSIFDSKSVADFRRHNEKDIEKFCQVIAESEKAIYDKRAATLRNNHPLAIQVNLDTGVANSVLVVRDAPTCVRLLIRILTNRLQFEVKEDVETNCWQLVERLTGSIFRVVTNDRKLTNCFWNFYRQGKGGSNVSERKIED